MGSRAGRIYRGTKADSKNLVAERERQKEREKKKQMSNRKQNWTYTKS